MAAPDVGPFSYARIDQPVRPFSKVDLVAGLMANVPATLTGASITGVSDHDGVKYVLADDSWLLIRPSGTEPVLRIYAEGRTDSQVQALLEEGTGLAKTQIAVMIANGEIR